MEDNIADRFFFQALVFKSHLRGKGLVFNNEGLRDSLSLEKAFDLIIEEKIVRLITSKWVFDYPHNRDLEKELIPSVEYDFFKNFEFDEKLTSFTANVEDILEEIGSEGLLNKVESACKINKFSLIEDSDFLSYPDFFNVIKIDPVFAWNSLLLGSYVPCLSDAIESFEVVGVKEKGPYIAKQAAFWAIETELDEFSIRSLNETRETIKNNNLELLNIDLYKAINLGLPITKEGKIDFARLKSQKEKDYFFD